MIFCLHWFVSAHSLTPIPLPFPSVSDPAPFPVRKCGSGNGKGFIPPVSVCFHRYVRSFLADRPPGRRGPSARLVGKRGSTGRSEANNRQSAPGCHTVRAPRGPSARAPQTVRACRAHVGPKSRGDKPAALLSLSQTARTLHPSLFLALSQRKAPLLGILI
jgi:hypothetical protein